MPKQLIIDGKAIEVEDGITLIQACEQAGVDVPRFCYHERLSIAGNCRMCLIEVQGIPKPVASCAMGVNDLMANKDGCSLTIRSIARSATRAANVTCRTKRWRSASAAPAMPKISAPSRTKTSVP
jgi:NADH-quinone oxidoreductase subunit G